MLQKWKLTQVIVYSFIVFVGIFFTVLGWSEESLLLMLRVSARIAVVLFLLAFLASTFIKIKKTPFTKWVFQNRKYIGVSFALVHIMHLGMVFARHFTFEPTLLTTEIPSRVGGAIVYALILLMTFTSFDKFAKIVSAKNWSRIHTIGTYFIWLIFFLSYVKRIKAGRYDAVYLTLFSILLLALLLKIGYKLKKRH